MLNNNNNNSSTLYNSVKSSSKATQSSLIGDTDRNTGISLLLSISVWVLLSPDSMSRDSTNSLMSLSTDGVVKEGLPKFNPRPGQGFNLGPFSW